jgi:hypothetical protein
MASAAAARRVKGGNLIGMVKMLRHQQKKRPFPSLSPAARALLAEQILVSDWYPYPAYLELLELLYKEMLGKSEERARDAGLAAGRHALSTVHRQFVKIGDPVESLLAIRHTWRAYYDFAELRAERAGPGSVRFSVEQYPDMPLIHGLMIAGWHVAGALEGGATDASTMILEAPWRGDGRFVHMVTFR